MNKPPAGVGRYRLLEFIWGAGAVAVVTAGALLLQQVTGYWAISLVYLLSVVLLALVLSRWAVLFVAALSAVLWNFLFIPPRFTFHIAATEDTLMFAMYFVMAVVMGHLTNQLREREAAERRREARTTALNRLLQNLAASASLEDGLARAVREVDAWLGSRTRILINGSEPDNAAALRLPLLTAKNRFGEMVVELPEQRLLMPNERELLDTFSVQIAVFIERHRALVAEQSERLHRTLLDSVSHELKTPLAVIGAATEGLDAQLAGNSPPLAQTFLDEVKAAHRRLNRIVTNLLEITRIESGRLPFNPEWGDVHDLLESTVEQIFNEVSRERIQVRAPDGLPLVRLDFGLMEQALCNLLLNAAQHGPAGSLIELSATNENGALLLRVTDHGDGVLPGEEQNVFEKFYRGCHARTGGTGLGLSIVRGIARAHGGDATAAGATFTIRIPQ